MDCQIQPGRQFAAMQSETLSHSIKTHKAKFITRSTWNAFPIFLASDCLNLSVVPDGGWMKYTVSLTQNACHFPPTQQFQQRLHRASAKKILINELKSPQVKMNIYLFVNLVEWYR